MTDTLAQPFIVTPTESPLTDHELAILRLISRGCIDPQISKATGHPVRTISSMVSRMMRRTESASRTHLVATALRNGWIR